MHEYDTVLKDLLQGSENSIFERVTGARIARWLPVEFPEVQQTRVDLLGETADEARTLVCLELQSANDVHMPLRMAEYSLRVYRTYQRLPRLFVLYVGEAEMRMPAELSGPDFSCRYKILDVRNLDAEALLDSPFNADNILAILAGHRDRRETIRRILVRIATLETSARDAALKKLTILSGLRKLGNSIRTEVQHMPILDDIMDHDLLGPAIRQGLQEGRQEEGLAILQRLIEKRFGPLPPWVQERLAKSSIAAIEDLSLGVLDAKTLNELFDR